LRFTLPQFKPIVLNHKKFFNTLDTTLFEYELPESAIAQVPVEKRGESRLLVINRQTGKTEDHQFRDLPELLPKPCSLFRNNATVLKARLYARRPHGGKVECLLLHPTNNPNVWWCLIKPARKLPPGSTFGSEGQYQATVLDKKQSGECRVEIIPEIDESILQLTERIGVIPLPPYIHRNRDDSNKTLDIQRYQTVYADPKKKVAAAAPTAGLHFTPAILDLLEKNGTKSYDLTLHVGLDTFRPIATGTIEDHLIHKEFYEVPAETCRAIHSAPSGSRLAVGTTSLRTLEDYSLKIDGSNPDSLSLEKDFHSEADIFIYPPATFSTTDLLLTNFHLPRSTLLCLVAAFLTPGEIEGIKWLKAIYSGAIEKGYRFYSYGDAMLVL
jgi:S-adenosylmethionine:tRNA ribosyltransferase-isomerase